MSSRDKPPQRHTASSDQDRLCQTCNKVISLVWKSDAFSTWDSQVRQWRTGTHRCNIQHGHLDLEFAQLLLLLLLLVVSLLVFLSDVLLDVAFLVEMLLETAFLGRRLLVAVFLLERWSVWASLLWLCSLLLY